MVILTEAVCPPAKVTDAVKVPARRDGYVDIVADSPPFTRAQRLTGNQDGFDAQIRRAAFDGECNFLAGLEFNACAGADHLQPHLYLDYEGSAAMNPRTVGGADQVFAGGSEHVGGNLHI